MPIIERLGIVGGGVVGAATARSWLEHAAEVRVYDVIPELRTHSLAEVLECDWIFVSLPTPPHASQGLDLSVIDQFFGAIPEGERQGKRFVLRSTVLPGTTATLYARGFTGIVYMPEFLTARCAYADASVPAQCVVGYADAARPAKINAHSLQYKLRQRFPGASHHIMSAGAAELAKLALNSFFATKVAFFNHVWEACAALGLSFDEVSSVLLSDGRVGASHHRVPGPDGKFGAGGACLPKDTMALASVLSSQDLAGGVILAAAAYNSYRQRDAGELTVHEEQ